MAAATTHERRLGQISADDPQVTDQMWLEAAHVHFRGNVILGHHLLEL